MKLMIELDTKSPTAAYELRELSDMLARWTGVKPQAGDVEVTTVEEAPKKKRTRKKAAPKVEVPVVEELPLTEEPTPSAPVKEDIRAAVTELIRVKGRPAAREVLTALDAIGDDGLPRISCIDKSRYDEALTMIAERL